MEFVGNDRPRHWALRMADIGWGRFYSRWEWKPIAEYDGHSVVLLRSPSEHHLGRLVDGCWCVDHFGKAAPIDHFDPTMFAAVTDEEAALLSID